MPWWHGTFHWSGKVTTSIFNRNDPSAARVLSSLRLVLSDALHTAKCASEGAPEPSKSSVMASRAAL